ncbi:pseudouridylate synthase 7 homolog [Battus philenor]|uniref:pseudouridylate synthase 7 homolog n=1 Tax=Battus philenor TaxID=42288 RepID=UPI0035D0AA93
MNNNWNANNRRGWGGQRGRGGRGRGNRGSWFRNDQWSTPRDQHSSYRNQDRGFRGGNRNDYGDRNTNRPRDWQTRPNRDSPGKRLSEEEIGVTEYMSDHEGFNGIIKCRYSDFQVSEINERGEVAKLTDISVPSPPREEDVDEDDDLVISKYNFEILPIETWDRINSLAVNPPTGESVEVDVTGLTKGQRTKIHDAVKKAFGHGIVGSTVTVDDKKFVKFEKYQKGVRTDNRVKWIWPGEYVYFVLHKENRDTMDAAAKLAEKLQLNIKPSMVGYAGTKDRRAKTTQWFSLRKVDPRKIAAALADVKDIHIGNFSFQPINLKLGMLKGNRFRIALRNVTASDEVIAEACQRLQTNGFINYYGLQRFGTRADIPTYEVGLKLLQSNFREAIDYILKDRNTSRGQFNRCFIGETRLRRAIQNNPKDLLGALHQLPRNQRILYLHAYQSLVWNRCVTERLRLYGKQPVVGDLVPLAEVPANTEEDDETDDDEKEDKPAEQNIANDAEKTPEPNKEEPSKDDAEKTKVKPENVQTKNIPKPRLPVKVLTEADVASGRYTLFDVVMPVPGHNIEYPPNMKDHYQQLVEKDNLKLDMIHKTKSYSLSGTYRHVVVRPGDLEWHTVRYDEPFSDLILSDLQELNGITTTGIVDGGKFKALILTMSLPASAYATMALRELLKVDTSNDSQAQQNNYFKTTTQDSKSETEEDKSTQDNELESERKGESDDKNGNVDTVNDKGENNDNVAVKRKVEDEGEAEAEVDAKKKREENEECTDNINNEQ